jgi:hypothetical protein
MKLSRKLFLLDALAYRVRVVSWAQLLALGPRSGSYERSLRRLIHRLEGSRLIRRLTVLARPAPVIDGPLFRWQPGGPAPDCYAIQYQAEKRNVQPVQAVTVFLGTERLANVLGGTCGGKLNLHSASHDLGVTQTYEYVWKADPNLALAWQGEDIVAPSRYRQKLPDAILFDPAGEPMLAVEYIGDYPADRIQAFHDDAERRGLAYEMY